jgi:hypothetical protein
MPILALRFLLWFIIGALVTAYILNRKSHDPVFGGLLAGLVGGIGGIIPLAIIWIWLWYFLPVGTFRRYEKVEDIWRR